MRIMKLFTLIFIGLMLGNHAVAQSLTETFDWMSNTLKPGEGNGVGINRPFPRSAKDIATGLDMYNSETITGFSHTGCHVEFDVAVANNDEILEGKHFDFPEVDTFDLKDIDPNTVIVAGIDIAWGEGNRGKVVVFRTSNAKPVIHVESSSQTSTSDYGNLNPDVRKNFAEMCKGEPKNTSYCDTSLTKGKPVDHTYSTLWFSTPGYAKRFAKALRHAVILCGGKPSTF